jgi:putative thiamine transport system permease protein
MAPALRPVTRRPLLALMPPLTLLVFLGPVAAGLAGAVLPAFGWLPALGGTRFSLDPWRQLLAAPGLPGAVRLAFSTGLGAALLAFVAAVGLSATLHESRAMRGLRVALAPLLSVPHAAFAVGVLFLVSPSGWIVRLLSPWATGWQRPPDLLLVQDPGAVALTLALAAKETFFLLLMLQAALAQLPAAAQLRVGRALGYGPVTAWVKLLLPQLYPQIRLPLYAVIAAAGSVVDMALVLGPTAPPTLAVRVMQWSVDPHLELRFLAAAGALLQGGVALLSVLAWRLAERLLGPLLRGWAVRGGRRSAEAAGKGAALLGGIAAAALAAAILVLGVWSLTDRWSFPAAWPERLSLAAWARALPTLSRPLVTTLGLGMVSSLVALALVAGCLEHEQRAGLRAGRGSLWLLYLPLLVPQLCFLFGVQVFFARLGLVGSWGAVLWTHLLFVVPYLFLTLGDAWRALDPRYARIALCLGHRPAGVFWRVKLPLLRRALLASLAVGFAVSVALYLPTALVGAGRVPTLATEVVSLAAGGDRRQLGAAGLLQALLPLGALWLAALLGRPRFAQAETGR